MKTPKLALYLYLIVLFCIIAIQSRSQTATIDGCITHGITGQPLEGALVDCGLYTCYSGADGYYILTIQPPGTFTLTCTYEDLCPFDTTFTINNYQSITIDIQLFPCPEFNVDPLNIEVILEPNQQTTEIITISNPGLESVNWTADLEIFPPAATDDFLDVQFMYPLSGTTGEKGIECDGEYFYTTSLNGTIYKYDLTSTLIETFSIGNNYSDLAFSGTYFYGAAGTTTIYEMDFSTQIIVSTFTAPGNVRAIAYNHEEDIFYGYSWGGDIIAFDQSGILLGSAPVGSSGSNYSGFAFDNVTEGGPYLWGYGLTGTELNVLVQLQLPSFQETGLIIDLDSLLGVPLNNVSGGLFTHPEIFPDSWTLGGVVTDEWIWGLELGENQNWDWISIEPTSGSLGPGESEEMSVNFDATDFIPWTYQAEIQFSTIPNVGSPVVDVTMDIEGPPMPPYDLEATINCVTVDLTWELSNLYYPPVTFNVYKNDTLIAIVPDKLYSDSLVLPEIQYEYAVSAVYTIGETMPSFPVNVTVPLPDSLEPLNLFYISLPENLILLNWNPPLACIEPSGYNVYRDNTIIGFIEDTAFLCSLGFYEFWVTAVYYFGESSPSNTVILTGLSETSSEGIEIFPIPTNEYLYIKSSNMIERIEIFNIAGKSLLQKEANSKSLKFIVSQLNPGIYFVKIETEHNMISRKIVIQ